MLVSLHVRSAERYREIYEASRKRGTPDILMKQLEVAELISAAEKAQEELSDILLGLEHRREAVHDKRRA